MTTNRKTYILGQDAPTSLAADRASSSAAITVYLNEGEPTFIVKSPTLRIEGTGTRASAIIEYRKIGYSIDRIIRAMPHLTKQQVIDTLSLYEQHDEIQAEIDEELSAQNA